MEDAAEACQFQFDDGLSDLMSAVGSASLAPVSTTPSKAASSSAGPGSAQKNWKEMPCAVCENFRCKAKSKYCEEHNRAADCLYRYAQKAGKEELEKHKSRMNDPFEEKLMLHKFVTEHPCGKTGVKRGNYDTVIAADRRVTTNAAGRQLLCKLMDFREAACYWRRKREMTTAECMAEWERLKADPTVGRDYNGMGSKDPLQLDVPKGNFGYAKKDAKHDREVTQPTKNLKLKDGDYQQWVAESQMGNTDFKSQFFNGVGVGGALAAMPANF